MTDCKPRVLTKDCPPVDPVTPPAQGTPFSICVGNYTLHYDGQLLSLEPRWYQIPDGTYSQLTFVDGCIEGAGQAPVAGYTPSQCCAPAGGGDPGNGGGTADITINPAACNLLKQDAQGLSVMPSVVGSNGIQITGCGTSANPLTVALAADPNAGNDLVITAAMGTLKVTAIPTGYVIGLVSIGSAHTTNGISVDEYGRVTAISTSNGGGGNSSGNGTLVGGTGITLTTTANVTTIGLTASSGLGSGSFTTTDGKRVVYDNTGRIISVVGQ